MRLRGQLGGGVTALGGVFQDNPPGGPFDADLQLLGSTRWGGNFNLRTGALFIAELQYALNQPGNGDMDYGNHTAGLPGTYKLGVWVDTAPFPSQRFDNTGLSLADPNTTGVPQMLRNNFSIYGVVDQMVWRPADDSPRSVGVFARLMGAPGDRNLINFSVNAGVVLKAPLPDRDDDSLGIGFGVAKVSPIGRRPRRRYRILLRQSVPGTGQRDVHRGHLPDPGHWLVAATTRFSIRVQSGRRHPKPQQPYAACRQRGDLRAAQHRDLLMMPHDSTSSRS